ncbi:hypothetical protein [Streptomyces anulatus]|uniref:hypothetical protein n=1 Tax=Streptomyces anulatus TaxID=1892 RepID=UPI00365769B4
MRIVDGPSHRYGHELRRKEDLTIRRLIRERHDDLRLPTGRQVDFTLSLLNLMPERAPVCRRGTRAVRQRCAAPPPIAHAPSVTAGA